MNPAPGLTAREPIMGAGLPSAHPPANPHPRRVSASTPEPSAAQRAASTSKKHLPHTPSLSTFRRGLKASHRSRWALKGDLIRAILSLGEDAPTADMLKSLRGCGAPRRGENAAPGVQARRASGSEGQDPSGWTSGIYHCNRRLCPVCGLRIAVRRILVLRKRAAWVAEHYPTALHATGALTCRHHAGNDPRAKYDALSALWNEWRKQAWVGGRTKKGEVVTPKTLLGYFACPEDTFGAHGHHPHLQFGASLAVPEGLDEEGRKAFFEAFRERSRAWFEAHAPRFGITCEWKEDWLVMAQSPVAAVVSYVLKGEKESSLRLEKEAARAGLAEDLDRLAREATLGQLKLDRAGAGFFDMPVIEQVRLWNATKGMRWFRVGGIWKDADTDKADETLADEDEEAGDVIAEIAPAAWTYLGSENRHILAALAEDVRYSRACVASVWAAAQDMAFARLDLRAIRDTLVAMIPPPPAPA